MANRTQSSRRGTTSRGARGPSRKRIWARQNAVGVVGVDGTAVDLLQEFESTYGAQLIGCTVARVRGKIVGQPQAAPTVADPGVVWAALVLNETGVSQDVRPVSEPHADYMFYEPCFALKRDVAGSDFSTGQFICDVDIKSMRKIEELNQSLWLVGESFDVGWSFRLSLSVLVLLP